MHAQDSSQNTSAVRQVAYLVALAAGCGVVAGSWATAVMAAQAIPLIIKAEDWEVEEVSETSHSHAHTEHAQEEAEWGPEDGLPRHLCTWAANMVIMFGFGLILVGVHVLRGHPIGGRSTNKGHEAALLGGLTWGVLGFVTFGLAPGAVLPPELPGMLAAELGDRQVCWALTSLLTFVGLALMFIQRKMSKALARLCVGCLGLFFMALPQLVGAPHHGVKDGSSSRPPPELAAQFVLSALVAQALSWLGLGMLTSVAYNRYFTAHLQEEELNDTASADKEPASAAIGHSVEGTVGGNGTSL